MAGPEKPRSPHYTSSTHIPIDRVGEIPSMRPKSHPDAEWRARVDERLDNLESAIATTAGEVRVEFGAAIQSLKVQVANAIPAAVDVALMPINARLDKQDDTADETKAIAERTAKAVEGIAAEKSAREQLKREAEAEEERVAALRAMNTQTELTVANTQKILVEAKHLAESDPKVDGRNRRRNATIATISGLIIAIAALAGLAANSQHQAPHIAAPADEPHH